MNNLHIFWDSDTGRPSDNICHLSDYNCVYNAYTNFRSNKSADCGCIPVCNDFWLAMVISTASFPGDSFLTSMTSDRLRKLLPDVSSDKFKDYLMKNVLVLNVFYKDPSGILYRTDIKFTIEDVIGKSTPVRV